MPKKVARAKKAVTTSQKKLVEKSVAKTKKETKKVSKPVLKVVKSQPAPAMKAAAPAPSAAPTPVNRAAAAKSANKSVENAKKALAKEKGAKEVTPLPTGPMAQKWSALFKKSDAIESKPYNMKQSYSEKTAIVHKVLGWGYILANRNDRLEVLFKDGIKYLISNYK